MPNQEIHVDTVHRLLASLSLEPDDYSMPRMPYFVARHLQGTKRYLSTVFFFITKKLDNCMQECTFQGRHTLPCKALEYF